MKEMPFNLEIEIAVIGATLISDEASEKVVQICKPIDFYNTELRDIFLAIENIVRSGDKVDLVTLHNHLGNKYLERLMKIDQNILSDANLDQHIRQLKEISHKRQIRRINPDSLDEFRELFKKIENDNIIRSYDPVVSVSDLLQTTIQYYNFGSDSGVSIGYLEADKYYRVGKGQFTVVTGIPYSGKSEMVDQITINLAQYENWKIAIFSPENFPISRHVKKLIEKKSGFPFFDGYHQKISFEDLKKELEWLSGHFYFLNPAMEDRNLDFILRQVRTLCIEKQIDGFVLDPWNEIEHARSDRKTETDYISECLSKIRYFARNYNIHIWIVAHPTKLQKDKDGRYPVPTPYDISGSAHWRNKADNCITIHRPELSQNKIELHVQKIRFKDNGRPGMLKFNYNIINGIFTHDNEYPEF